MYYKKDASLVVSKDAGLNVDAENTKYIFMSRVQNAGQNQTIKMGNKAFGSVTKFKYLGTILTNQI